MTGLLRSVVSIVTGAHAEDWREAVRLAGDGLVRGGCATERYTAAMVAAVEEHGPYIVIAPGLALAHARPSPAVLGMGLSWVGLARPVEFGHRGNDPVHVVIGLAATDPKTHLTVMAELADVLGDPATFARLTSATSAAEVRAALSGPDAGRG